MAITRANGVAGKLSTADLTTTSTSMSSAGLADLPAVASPDIAKVTLFQTDSNGRVTKQEIVYVTAHTASATSATITRAQEGTTAAAWNGTTAPDSWVHAPTAVEQSGRLARVEYNPATLTTTSTTSTTPVDVDPTNLVVTFTAPASGKIEVVLSSCCYNSTAGNAVYWGLRESTTNLTPRQQVNATANVIRVTVKMLLTGLTAGSSHTYKWSHWANAFTANTRYGDDGTNAGLAGPAIMEVWAVDV